MMRLLRKRDAYLSQTVRTERFDLVPCGISDAFNISWRWSRDKEILSNLRFDTSPRTRIGWIREMQRPDNFRKFTHAIIPRGGRAVIGLHMTKLIQHKSATAEIAVHDRAWWGRGVFYEVRSALMDHFFGSDRVERFQTVVNTRNFASVFNYNKLGFRCVGTMRRAQFDPATGTYFDVFIFEMLQSDWKLPAERQTAAKQAGAKQA